ncbi:MAG: ribosome-associated translation inhibitor RaiA [Sphingobacteriales bacterium]|nr:MAG: ribosome-associated translation inhibitor RaiA [Sphingobacteriales bacterium]
MDIIIQSLGFKASDNLDGFVREKLSKLDHMSHKIIRADVTLFEESTASENNYCEIRLEVPGNDHFVKKHGSSFEQAVADTVDALQNTLRKAKEKMIDRRQAKDV